MILRVVCPLLRHKRIILYENTPIIYSYSQLRQKSNKDALTSRRSEVDTNVKPLGEKVKETTKTASYLGVILLGVGVTGALFYAVFNELFSSKSPNNVYTKAAKRCLNDPRIQDSLGQPITTYGEETRRGRRQHVSHLKYEKNGKRYLRMRFYLQGSFRKGTVQLEMMENESGNYEYRYLFVEIDDLLRSTIVLEDNRKETIAQQMPLLI
ncbi:hypothetical protein ILUMI_13825 [Ignelater luminosus]|uniref:Mitochondrial import inner membrane translocase subunit Tim21 n=1 Tax=Ignelater luminosus TaxID=2038154 RepID=A0A8K0GAJ6_IGNLU|nr:hypothetical protein ILUMI_13825 [Ignelater luminosus]